MTRARQPAAPRNTDQRTRELARIHTLAKQVGLDPKDPDPKSDYRQMLLEHGARPSAGAMNAAQRAAVLAHLIGATATPARPRRAATGSPQARLIYHLWRSLHTAGHVRHLDGLPAWLQQQTAPEHPLGTGYERPELLPRDTASDVIEQLKLWCDRLGVAWK